MALGPNELLSSASKAATKRFFPTSVQPKKFDPGAGTIPAGSMLAILTATGFLTLFEAGAVDGTEVMVGFAWPDDIVLDAADEVLGNVMMEGRVHVDDIISTTTVPAGLETLAQIKTELSVSARALNFVVEGYDVLI
jgi:hypothetical protein